MTEKPGLTITTNDAAETKIIGDEKPAASPADETVEPAALAAETKGGK